jgi:hypothetical protein
MVSLLVALLVSTPPQPPPQPPPHPPPPLTVHVLLTPEPAANGFATPIPKDVLDILQQIKKHLRKTRGLQLVEARAGADLVLKFTARRWDAEESGVSAAALRSASGRVIVADAEKTYTEWIVMEVALITPAVTHPLKAQESSGKKAAATLAKEAVAWLAVNERAIRAHRD